MTAGEGSAAGYGLRRSRLELYFEGAAGIGADAGHFEELGDAVAVFGRDCQFGRAEDGVADVGVEAAIVAGQGFDVVLDEHGGIGGHGGDGELAPGGLLLLEPDVLVEPSMGTLAPPTSAGSCGSRPYF